MLNLSKSSTSGFAGLHIVREVKSQKDEARYFPRLLDVASGEYSLQPGGFQRDRAPLETALNALFPLKTVSLPAARKRNTSGSFRMQPPPNLPTQNSEEPERLSSILIGSKEAPDQRPEKVSGRWVRVLFGMFLN